MESMRIASTEAAAFAGGGILGTFLSSEVILLLDRYSRLETFVKISSYIGLAGPEGMIAFAVLGFALLIYATNAELKRVADRAAFSVDHKVSLELFKWETLQKGALRPGLFLLC